VCPRMLSVASGMPYTGSRRKKKKRKKDHTKYNVVVITTDGPKFVVTFYRELTKKEIGKKRLRSLKGIRIWHKKVGWKVYCAMEAALEGVVEAVLLKTNCFERPLTQNELNELGITRAVENEMVRAFERRYPPFNEWKDRSKEDLAHAAAIQHTRATIVEPVVLSETRVLPPLVNVDDLEGIRRIIVSRIINPRVSADMKQRMESRQIALLERRALYCGLHHGPKQYTTKPVEPLEHPFTTPPNHFNSHVKVWHHDLKRKDEVELDFLEHNASGLFVVMEGKAANDRVNGGKRLRGETERTRLIHEILQSYGLVHGKDYVLIVVLGGYFPDKQLDRLKKADVHAVIWEEDMDDCFAYYKVYAGNYKTMLPFRPRPKPQPPKWTTSIYSASIGLSRPIKGFTSLTCVGEREDDDHEKPSAPRTIEHYFGPAVRDREKTKEGEEK